MPEPFSLEELSDRINAWCAKESVFPANGQAGEAVSERTVRYYRTLGLVDPPADGGYDEKHLLQLSAIRLLQAQGLPLRRIRELLFGRTLEELREVRRRGLAERPALEVTPPFASGGDELWRMIPLDRDFLLVSRHGTPISPEQRAAVLCALQTGHFAKSKSS